MYEQVSPFRSKRSQCGDWRDWRYRRISEQFGLGLRLFGSVAFASFAEGSFNRINRNPDSPVVDWMTSVEKQVWRIPSGRCCERGSVDTQLTKQTRNDPQKQAVHKGYLTQFATAGKPIANEWRGWYNFRQLVTTLQKRAAFTLNAWETKWLFLLVHGFTLPSSEGKCFPRTAENTKAQTMKTA